MSQTIASKPQMSWRDSVWFSDVDDTLIDTAGTSSTASDGIQAVFEARFGAEKASEVQTNFNNLFALMMAGYRVRNEEDWQQLEGGKKAFDDLVAYFASCQKQVTATYGHFKKWSREVFVKRAAELAGLAVTPELVHEAADAYWLTLTERTQVFPDALQLSQAIAARRRPLFLVTSSDARLKMQPDGQFIYDPAYSEALKRERIELLREKGLQLTLSQLAIPKTSRTPTFSTRRSKEQPQSWTYSLIPARRLCLAIRLAVTSKPRKKSCTLA